MIPFAYFPTPQFSAKLEKIHKADPPVTPEFFGLSSDS